MDSVKEPTPSKRRMDVVFSDAEPIKKDDFELLDAIVKTTDQLANILDSRAMPSSVDAVFSYEDIGLQNVQLPDSIESMIKSEQRPHTLTQVAINYSREPDTAQASITAQFFLDEQTAATNTKGAKQIITCVRPGDPSADSIADATDTESATTAFPMVSEDEFYGTIISIITRDNVDLAEFIHQYDKTAFMQHLHNPFAYDDVAQLFDHGATNSVVNEYYSVEDPITQLPVVVETRKRDSEIVSVDFELATGLDGESWIIAHTEQYSAPIAHALQDEDSEFFGTAVEQSSSTSPAPYLRSNLTFSKQVGESEPQPYTPSLTDFEAMIDVQLNIVESYR